MIITELGHGTEDKVLLRQTNASIVLTNGSRRMDS